MLLSDDGKSTDSREVQPEKAASSMTSSRFGSVTLFSVLLLWKVCPPSTVTYLPSMVSGISSPSASLLQDSSLTLVYSFTSV